MSTNNNAKKSVRFASSVLEYPVRECLSRRPLKKRRVELQIKSIDPASPFTRTNDPTKSPEESRNPSPNTVCDPSLYLHPSEPVAFQMKQLNSNESQLTAGKNKQKTLKLNSAVPMNQENNKRFLLQNHQDWKETKLSPLEKDSYKCYHEDVLPPNTAHKIVGKDGVMIRDLQARSGTRLYLRDSFVTATTTLCYRAPTSQHLENARRMVGLVLNNRAVELPLGLAKQQTHKIPQRLAGKLVGPSGRTIVRLQHASKANVKVQRCPQDPNWATVQMIATPYSLALAAQMMQYILQYPNLSVDELNSYIVRVGFAPPESPNTQIDFYGPSMQEPGSPFPGPEEYHNLDANATGRSRRDRYDEPVENETPYANQPQNHQQEKQQQLVLPPYGCEKDQNSSRSEYEHQEEGLIEWKESFPARLMHKIVGQRGEVLQDLSARSGVQLRVEVVETVNPQATMYYLGTSDQVNFASQMVAMLQDEHYQLKNLPLGHAICRGRVLTPREFLLLQRREPESNSTAMQVTEPLKSSLVVQMMALSKARIVVSPLENTASLEQGGQLRVTGTEQAVQQAAALLDRWLQVATTSSFCTSTEDAGEPFCREKDKPMNLWSEVAFEYDNAVSSDCVSSISSFEDPMNDGDSQDNGVAGHSLNGLE